MHGVRVFCLVLGQGMPSCSGTVAPWVSGAKTSLSTSTSSTSSCQSRSLRQGRLLLGVPHVLRGRRIQDRLLRVRRPHVIRGRGASRSGGTATPCLSLSSPPFIFPHIPVSPHLSFPRLSFAVHHAPSYISTALPRPCPHWSLPRFAPAGLVWERRSRS